MLRTLIVVLMVSLLSVVPARADDTSRAEGETILTAEGEAAPVAEGEASPAPEGEAAPSAEGEAAPAPEGEAASAPEGEAAPAAEGEAPAAAPVPAPQPFAFEDVVERARRLADKPFEAPGVALPNELANVDYDAFRQIRFRPDRALWRNERMFELQFFHLGFLYLQPVRINVVDGGVTSEVMFDPGMFDYAATGLERAVPPLLGFAGFRIHYPLHGPDYKDEVGVFLGASYFRILGRDQQFGASARGLAVDTAHPRGEEFPIFREFWLVKPQPDEHVLTIYALLDSERVTGAYRFVLRPGTTTAVDVSAEVFARADIDKIGIAPLTSMFLFGEGDARKFDDFRPEVHDSDGLLMQTGAGRWIWRPLVNHRELQVSAFSDTNPRGFGLVQRDRDFTNYLDMEAAYHRRPGLWVEPVGEWGEGTVELVEIPLADETNDNIVAYWTPRKPLKAGEAIGFAYRLKAVSELPFRLPLAHAERTLTGAPSVVNPERFAAGTRLFVVDFNGGDLPHLDAGQPVEARIAMSAGRIVDQIVQKIPETGGWRVAFRVDPEGNGTVDLTLKLMLYGLPIAEDWAYLWQVRP
jgi:periplasmic glucans biosynthesis protein